MKLRMTADQFSVETGRVPAGAVVDLDPEQARRWLALGIAEKAGAGAKTYREERREALRRELAELNEPVEVEAEPSWDDVQDVVEPPAEIAELKTPKAPLGRRRHK